MGEAVGGIKSGKEHFHGRRSSTGNSSGSGSASGAAAVEVEAPKPAEPSKQAEPAKPQGGRREDRPPRPPGEHRPDQRGERRGERPGGPARRAPRSGSRRRPPRRPSRRRRVRLKAPPISSSKNSSPTACISTIRRTPWWCECATWIRGTKSQLRRLYNAVRRAVRAPESERQHQFVMLRARLAYTIARHSLRSSGCAGAAAAAGHAQERRPRLRAIQGSVRGDCCLQRITRTMSTHTAQTQLQLVGKLILSGDLHCETGLHIGAGKGSLEIGGADNPGGEGRLRPAVYSGQLAARQDPVAARKRAGPDHAGRAGVSFQAPRPGSAHSSERSSRRRDLPAVRPQSGPRRARGRRADRYPLGEPRAADRLRRAARSGKHHGADARKSGRRDHGSEKRKRHRPDHRRRPIRARSSAFPRARDSKSAWCSTFCARKTRRWPRG